MKEAKMICPYCNAEFSPEMNAKIEETFEGCDTCGYGKGADFTIDIYCSKCYKLVYKKEFHNIDM
jgi:hypothetical protein